MPLTAISLATCQKKTTLCRLSTAEACGELFSAHLHKDLFCFVPDPCSQPMPALLSCGDADGQYAKHSQVQFIFSTALTLPNINTLPSKSFKVGTGFRFFLNISAGEYYCFQKRLGIQFWDCTFLQPFLFEMPWRGHKVWQGTCTLRQGCVCW